MGHKKKKLNKSSIPEAQYKFAFLASGWMKLKVDKQLFKGSNSLIKSDLSKYKIELDNDYEEFAIVKNAAIDIINLDNTKHSITRKSGKELWVQDYSYSIHFSVPFHRVDEFRRLLINQGAEGSKFEDYSWGDFPSRITGLRSPNYLEEIDERTYGNIRDARSTEQLRLLWNVIFL